MNKNLSAILICLALTACQDGGANMSKGSLWSRVTSLWGTDDAPAVVASAPAASAANQASSEPAAVQAQTTQNDAARQAEEAQKWLVGSLNAVLQAGQGGDESEDAVLKKVTTPEYFAYYQEMSNVSVSEEYDNDMTAAELVAMRQAFERRWQGKFDTSFGSYGGFIIGPTDPYKPSVADCRLISADEKGLLFDVMVRSRQIDSEYEYDYSYGYSAKILVRRTQGQYGNDYRIADATWEH